MNKGTLARKVVVAAIATLTAFAGLAPFAPGASAAANYTQIRYAGEDRFETAALIADAIAEATPTAVIARADIYPDALTGAYAAANNDDAPILLTRSDELPQTTIDALEDKNVDDVILLGGPDAIDASVENELEGLGYNVSRLFGETRYQTAIDIAENGTTIGTIDGDRAALVASGENFPDALSGAPLSFAAFLPSLLVPKDVDDSDPGVEAILRSYVQDVIDSLDGLGIERVYFIGGGEAVSEEIEDEFVTAGFDTARLAGENRGGTSVEVFEFGMDEGIYTNRRFGITRGDTFPDALAYAPLAGRARPTVAPDTGVADTGGSSNGLLLANGTCDLHEEVSDFIAEHSDTWTQGEILGGEEAICPELASEIDQLASQGFAGVTLNESSTNVGGTITGNITGDDIQSVTVSGCGFNNQAVTRDAEGDFSLTFPATQTTDCTLVFTTTFTDGRVETDTFQIDVRQPGEPDATLSPTSGVSGTSVQSTYSGTRPANITDVNSTNCTITNEGTQSQNRTFTVTGADGTACQIQTVVTFTDAAGGTQTLTDTFTITAAGQQPGGVGQGVGAGTQLATAAPDLLSTTIINGVPNDTIPNQVRYTYDEAVLSPVLGDFSLQGPDSDTILLASSAAIDSADPRSVIVQFTDTTDLRTFTIGTSDEGAVTDGANFSVLASKPLGGSGATTTTGRTAAPDFVSASPNVTAQEVTYCFDQPINNAIIQATRFGYYTDSGAESRGDTATTPSGTQNCVTVQFGGLEPGGGANADQPVESGDRFFVEDSAGALDSAVRDFNNALDNPLGHEPQSATTIRPDLISAVKVAGQPNQIDFTFDEAVTAPGTPGLFVAYQDDGTRFNGTAVAQNGTTTVRVTFPGINQNNVGQIVLAGVEQNAIFSASAATEGNTVGDAPLTGGTSQGAGFTDGPDLIGATFNTTSNQVTFQFDEPVSDAGGGFAPNEQAFFVVDAAGVATCGNPFDAVLPAVSGNNVTVTFASGVASAAGAGVNTTTDGETGTNCLITDAAFDFLGNNNSPDSVGGGGAPAS